MLTGELISAPEALRIGLVNRVIPLPDLISASEDLAKKIMVNGPQAVRFCMRAVQRGLDTSLQEGLAQEAGLFGVCCASEDMREGTAAFLEKRAPDSKASRLELRNKLWRK